MVYAPETLFGLGKNGGAAKAIFGGWSIAPIVTIQSGRRYSAGLSSDLWGANGNRLYPANARDADGNVIYPVVKRNSFSQPAIGNVDLRISRRFTFGETMSFEVLAEGFNIFNRQNITRVETRAYNRSGSTLNFNTRFGTPTAAGNNIFRERQIQLSGRFRF